MQRSKREGSEIGFAARKHSEMDLRMQRSGREGAVVGFAGQGQTEANLWWQRSGRERIVVGFAEREGRGWGARGGRGEEEGRLCKQRSGAWIGASDLCVFPAGWFFLQDSFSCILAAVQGVCCYLFRKFVEKVPEGGLVYDLTVHESAVCYDERCWDGRDVIQAYVW